MCVYIYIYIYTYHVYIYIYMPTSGVLASRAAQIVHVPLCRRPVSP